MLRFVALLLVAAGGLLSGAQTVVAQTASRPNVVVFLIDDMGIMDTSLPFLTDEQGEPRRYPLNDYYRTPSMERLAAQGIRFNQFCAMSVCSPTRISIMTGQNAARHRTTNWIRPNANNRGPFGPPDWNWEGLDNESITLARLLQGSGYRTIHVGKGHFGPNDTPGSEPLNLGFDVNIGGFSAGQPGNYYGNQGYGVPGLEKYHGTGTFLTEALTREAIAAVDQAVADQEPFFLYFAHYAVHAPFHSDPRFAPHYADSGKSAQAQAFATLIEGMDKSLGDLLDHLESQGIADDTIILFLGDNGSDAPLGGPHVVACAAPLRGKKGAHYEGGMRVPFIAAWAKPQADHPLQQRVVIPAGAIQTQQASVCDLFPTILGLTEIETPEEHVVDGWDLTRLMSGESDPARPERFLMHYPHSPHRSDYFTVLRDGDWKIVYHYRPTDVSAGSHYQLFNLADDPFEQHELTNEQPEQVVRMMRLMIEELQKHDAVYPIDENGNELRPELPGE
ncbi:MAG: sulfatase [Pirellulaceae bacterium]